MAKDKMTTMRCEATGEDVKVPQKDLEGLFEPSFRIFADDATKKRHISAERQRGCRLLHRGCVYVSPKKNVRRFDTENARFSELLDSIKGHGIITPLVVKRSDENQPYGYVLVAGFRRFEAATRAELDHIPCVLADKDDNMQVVGLLENLGREEMNPMEKAAMLAKLQMLGKGDGKGKLSQRDVARKVGMAQSQVSDLLSLTKDVHSDVAAAVADGELPVSKAAILKQLPPKDQKKQLKMAGDVDVKELRKHIGKVRTDLGIEAPAHGPSPKARTLRKKGRKLEFRPISDIYTRILELEDLVFEQIKGKKSDKRELAALQWVVQAGPENSNDGPVKWSPPPKKKKAKKAEGKGAKKDTKKGTKADKAEAADGKPKKSKKGKKAE